MRREVRALTREIKVPLSAMDLLVAAIIFFIPLKFFALKAGFVFSFYRFLILFAMIALGLKVLIASGRNSELKVPAEFFSRRFLFLLAYSILIFGKGLIDFWGDPEFSRLLIMTLRYLEFFLVLPLLYFLCTSTPLARKRIFQLCSNGWWYVCLLGALQVFVDQIGFSVSFESIGEYSLENRAEVAGGLSFLRASSLFGEPRDLAALVVPILLMRAMAFEREVRPVELCLAVGIGMLTFSNTFFIVILLYLCLFVLSRSSISTATFAAFTASILVLVLYNFQETLIEEMVSLVPRLGMIFEVFSEDVLTAYGSTLGGDIADQISDFMLLPYLLSLSWWSVDGIFGHGIGSSQIFLRAFADIKLGFTNPDVTFGTRFQFFIFLIDFGWIGFLLFLRWLYSRIVEFSATFQDAGNYRLYSLMILCCSLLNDGLFVMVFALFLSCTIPAYKAHRKAELVSTQDVRGTL